MKKSVTLLLLAAAVGACGMPEDTDDAVATTTPEPDEIDIGAAERELQTGLPAVGYHTVVIADPLAWNAINAVASEKSGPMIASQNRPDTVPNTRWAKHLSVMHFKTGEAMADAIASSFEAPEPPARIMIDELRSNSLTKVTDMARRMKAVYPQYEKRWGVYVTTGDSISYARLNPAIDAVLDANGELAVEFYAYQSEYCASGYTSAQRDAWLAGYFRGEQGAFPQPRFRWLAERRLVRKSQSRLSVVFGVIDRFAAGVTPAKFIDRMFYVWMNQSRFRSAALMSNGGPGAWKWDMPYMSSTSRDAAFIESLQHYSIDGRLTSRLGPVPCN